MGGGVKETELTAISIVRKKKKTMIKKDTVAKKAGLK